MGFLECEEGEDKSKVMKLCLKRFFAIIFLDEQTSKHLHCLHKTPTL